jgi:hypothetical protein
MNKSTFSIFGVWVSLVLALTMNYLSNALPINGQNASQVSAKFPTYFTPAGFAFSIWGVIYLGLIAFAIYQSLPAQKANARIVAARPWVILNGLLNSVWLPLFHYEQMGLALMVILGILFTLIKIHEALQTGRKTANSWTETLVARWPFSIYLGWLCVATIANASIFLNTVGWLAGGYGLSASEWSVVMIAIATLVAGVFYWQFRDAAFLLVFVWAFWAIYQKQQGVEWVQNAALVAICILIIGLLAGFLRRPNFS